MFDILDMGVLFVLKYFYNIVFRRFFVKYYIISVDFFEIFFIGWYIFVFSKNLFVESYYKIVGLCVYIFGINVV